MKMKAVRKYLNKKEISWDQLAQRENDHFIKCVFIGPERPSYSFLPIAEHA